MPIDGEEWMDMSAAADVAPEFERLTRPPADTRTPLDCVTGMDRHGA